MVIKVKDPFIVQIYHNGVQRTLHFPLARWVYIAACSCWSNLGSVHQVPITAGWPEAVWNAKFAQHFYTWPAPGIEPMTSRFWVKCLNHHAMCFQRLSERIFFLRHYFCDGGRSACYLHTFDSVQLPFQVPGQILTSWLGPSLGKALHWEELWRTSSWASKNR